MRDSGAEPETSEASARSKPKLTHAARASDLPEPSDLQGGWISTVHMDWPELIAELIARAEDKAHHCVDYDRDLKQRLGGCRVKRLPVPLERA